MLLSHSHRSVTQPFLFTGLLIAAAFAPESRADTGASDTPSLHSGLNKGVVIGDQTFTYTVTTSLWTTHFNPRPEHNNTQYFLGIERHGDNFVTRPLQARFETLAQADPMLGIAHFQNSFAQSTLYAYAGFTKNFWNYKELNARVKVSAGFIHGYRNEFQNKIPFNNFGTSPAAIPSVSLHYRRFNTEMILFGTSGLMLNVGYSF